MADCNKLYQATFSSSTHTFKFSKKYVPTSGKIYSFCFLVWEPLHDFEGRLQLFLLLVLKPFWNKLSFGENIGPAKSKDASYEVDLMLYILFVLQNVVEGLAVLTE